MTHTAETKCVIYDKTPKSQQKRINIIVRPQYSVGKIMEIISTFYPYANFDLILQPPIGNLVHMNEFANTLLFEIPGFEENAKNTMILLPAGEWQDNLNKRFELTGSNSSLQPLMCSPKPSKKISNKKSADKLSRENDSGTFLPGTNGDNEIDSTTKNSILTTTSQSTIAPITIRTNENNKENSFETSNGHKEPELHCNNDNSDTIINQNNKINNSTINNNSDAKNHMHDGSEDIQVNNYSKSWSPSSPDVEQSDCENFEGNDLVLGASAGPPGTLLSADLSNNTIKAIDEVANNENNKYTVYSDKQSEVTTPCSSMRNYRHGCKRNSTSVTRDAIDLENSEKLSELPPCSNSICPKYVGLVNQAMTCYLNSLLQALFMTPEFRNALYRWECDNTNEKKNIPNQLQKLFLRLQTSKKSAVETTDLTRSFGWDSNEAWQQHDIQELCRVMFEALERKFMTTKQANLISNLYEGKMIDYVKCLECKTEKTRADKFLDIPLPVRPFGSNVAYGSVEEALRAFVRPETLDGNNQYFCENCNKKCDAHKGLKFSAFPYILTLHLTRFAFDPYSFARVKLNDVVTFPEILNLNSFVSEEDYKTNGSQDPTDDHNANSGSTVENVNSSNQLRTAGTSQNDMKCLDDEGIELSTNNSTNQIEALECASANGRYMYELFAIMIHSGNASGGHYYAYIKDFDCNKWFSFNDQNVTPITKEDIERSYGGTTNITSYSSYHASSINAYMLMYRQIDKLRNEIAMSVDEFPLHIKELLPHLAVDDEGRKTRVRQPVSQTNLSLPEFTNPRIYFYNPEYRKYCLTRSYVSRTADLEELLMSAYAITNTVRYAPIERCRLVAFDGSCDKILQSFDDPALPSVSDVIATCDGRLSFLLEYRAEGQKFDIYKPGGVTWYVFNVVISTMQIDGPYLVYSQAQEYNDVLRESIANRMFINSNEFIGATMPLKRAFIAYDPAPTPSAERNLLTIARKHFRSLVHFYVSIPHIDLVDLECLGISTDELRGESGFDVVDAVLMNGAGTFSDGDRQLLEQPLHDRTDHRSVLVNGSSNYNAHGSNSDSLELSNLDDNAIAHTKESLYDLNKNNLPMKTSPTNSFPSDFGLENKPTAPPATEIGEVEFKTHFCHVLRINELETVSTSLADLLGRQNLSNSHSTAGASSADEIDGQGRTTGRTAGFGLKIIANSHMSMGEFKRHLEPYIGLPADLFALKRAHETSDPLSLSMSLLMIQENEVIGLEVGKCSMEYNEHKTKISYMRVADLNNETGELPHICDWLYLNDVTVAMAKVSLVAKFHRIDPIKYSTLTVDNCRLWLKSGKNPLKILADHIVLADEVSASTLASEFLIQEMEPGQSTQPPPEHGLVIFVRHWHSDTMICDGFQELTLTREFIDCLFDNKLMNFYAGETEIRDSISQLSGIPMEHIGYTKLSSSFPCTNISILTFNANLTWLTNPATLDKYPLNTTIDANIFLYKDMRVKPLELSLTERRKWAALEKSRLDRLGYTSSSLISPRRERALKIYFDSPPVATQPLTEETINGSDPPTSNKKAID